MRYHRLFQDKKNKNNNNKKNTNYMFLFNACLSDEGFYADYLVYGTFDWSLFIENL